MEMRETVLGWLRDAHAMEAAAVNNLEKNIDRFKDYPMVQQKFREDLQFSKRNLEELEQYLDQMGDDSSMLKDMAMKFAGAMQPFVTAMSPDEPVKHLRAAHAYEHFEMASYRSLSAAAETIGEPRLKEICDRSLRQKQDMAEWIDAQLPSVTKEYLNRAH